MLHEFLSYSIANIPSKFRVRNTMSSSITKLTTYAQNASRSPVLNDKESKKALEDTSWADVRMIFLH